MAITRSPRRPARHVLPQEPADGTELVVRDRAGRRTLIWRDDARAADLAAHPDDRWFTDPHRPPMSWAAVLATAELFSGVVPLSSGGSSPRDIHTSFGLSYSEYLIVARTLLQSMPLHWQHMFVALLDQMTAASRHVEQAEGYEVRPGRWIYVGECTGPELARAEAQLLPPDEDLADDPDDPDDVPAPRYLWRGEVLADHEYVFVPGQEPVPSYNRGRTRVELHLTAAVG